MKFEKYYIVANTRDQFENESKESQRPYSDHPSRESIDSIVAELGNAGYNAEYFGGIDELIDAYTRNQTFPHTLFLNLSDGLNQVSRKGQSAILLELLGVPYVGSDPLACLIAGNKAYAKRIVSEKMETPQSITVFRQSPLPTRIQFPVIVKPNREGSSLGITQESICSNLEDLRIRSATLLKRFPDVLIEEYIPGYEITCFIIGNRDKYLLNEPLLCEYNGMRYFEKFVFGLEEKASRTRKEYLARDILDAHQIDSIRHSAQTAFEMLNMSDFARVDFRLQRDGRLVFLEINSNAVISKTSEIGVISRELDIPFGELVSKIICTATERIAVNRG